MSFYRWWKGWRARGDRQQRRELQQAREEAQEEERRRFFRSLVRDANELQRAGMPVSVVEREGLPSLLLHSVGGSPDVVRLDRPVIRRDGRLPNPRHEGLCCSCRHWRPFSRRAGEGNTGLGECELAQCEGGVLYTAGAPLVTQGCFGCTEWEITTLEQDEPASPEKEIS